MKVEWYYLKPADYKFISSIKNKVLRDKLYAQYIGKIPMLKLSYERLKKQYR